MEIGDRVKGWDEFGRVAVGELVSITQPKSVMNKKWYHILDDRTKKIFQFAECQVEGAA